MTMVGIRELKAHLSRYLRTVKNGEVVAVTEHGKQIAILSPLPGISRKSALPELARRGLVIWGGGRPKGSRHPIKIKGKPLSQTIIEDREDRI